MSRSEPLRSHTGAAGGVTQGGLILSIFPGVGLLDRAFESLGLCVVRGPDLLWGGDVRSFHPPAGCWWGVMGGPPCQDFSSARRAAPTGYGREMLEQFARIVREAEPDWWLLENVSRVPDVHIAGYNRQRFSIDQSWWDPVSRLRHWQYGFRWRVEDASFGAWLDPPLGKPRPDCVPAALANDDRPWDMVRTLQGLPESYDLPGFTTAGKVAAVGNGVPQSMGRAVALAVLAAWGLQPDAAEVPAASGDVLRCRCGCGRITRGRQRYAAAACRKRAQRQRDQSIGR